MFNRPDNQVHLPEFDNIYKLTEQFVIIEPGEFRHKLTKKDTITFSEFVDWSKFRLLQRGPAELVSNSNAFQGIQFCCLWSKCWLCEGGLCTCRTWSVASQEDATLQTGIHPSHCTQTLVEAQVKEKKFHNSKPRGPENRFESYTARQKWFGKHPLPARSATGWSNSERV